MASLGGNVTIALGASLSDAVDIGQGAAVVRIGMPTAWTAAVLTLSVSDDNVTYRNLYDRNGNEYTLQAGTARSIIVPPADTYGSRYLKVRSGTSGTPVTQATAQTLRVLARPI